MFPIDGEIFNLIFNQRLGQHSHTQPHRRLDYSIIDLFKSERDEQFEFGAILIHSAVVVYTYGLAVADCAIVFVIVDRVLALVLHGTSYHIQFISHEI